MCQYILDIIILKLCATLNLPKFPKIILSDRFNHPCRLHVFFSMFVCCQILNIWHACPFVHIFMLFCALPLPISALRTDLSAFIFYHMYTPTHIYACTTCIWLFWGNFPAIRPKSMCLCPNICACLPCLLVSLHPCTLSHPSAPIRTHLHLFAPTQTLNCTAYMYYLGTMLI